MSNRDRITDPAEMIQYLRDYAIVKNEPTIADAAEMMERLRESVDRIAQMNSRFEAENARLQAERDAAVADILHDCITCVHLGEDGELADKKCASCNGNIEARNTYEDNYQWCGVREGAEK